MELVADFQNNKTEDTCQGFLILFTILLECDDIHFVWENFFNAEVVIKIFYKKLHIKVLKYSDILKKINENGFKHHPYNH